MASHVVFRNVTVRYGGTIALDNISLEIPAHQIFGIIGPANSGKVATLLDRYLSSLDEDPILIVPNRPDVDRIERDLLERSPALLGGSIGTFADLFEQLARSDTSARPVASEAQRALIVRRVVADATRSREVEEVAAV